MTQSPNKITNFWQELKRRKVVRVITIYAAAAFVILELTDIVAPSLGLPDWTLNFIIILICVGFIITVVVSWIYDIHPEGGIVKTEPAHKVIDESAPPSSKGWKIASYISFIVIVGLVVLNIIPRTGKKEILEKSIAVLPFRNDSPDEEKMYFINGTMEAILDNLCKIEDLRVPGRTTVEQYRNVSKPIPDIAKELNVSYVLEGSGQKLGNRLLLTVQLLDGKNDRHLWSRQYDREINRVEDLIDIPSEIAQLVAMEIEAIITDEEKMLIEKIPTTNSSAYDLYLKGIQEYYDFWETGVIDHVHLSIGYFMKAIELDPEYSLAYTGLGRGYWMLGQFGPDRSPLNWEESKRLLKKAISLDPANGWAYSELGVVLSNWYWDSAASSNAFEKALELSPNREDVYDHYVYHTYRTGNCERLATLIRESKNRFDPDNDIEVVNSNLLLLSCREEFEEITRIADLEWERNSGFIETTYIAQAYAIIGDYERALDVSEYMLESHPIREYGLTMNGMILGLMGNKDGARKSLNELLLLSESRNVSPTLFAGVSLALGDIEKTKDYLEQALKERDLLLHEIHRWASFYTHKNEPWLKEMINRSWIPLVDSESETELTN